MAAGQWQEGRVAGFTALPERTVDAVFKTVVANQAQFGVVPIENSHTGISATTRDLLVQVRPHASHRSAGHRDVCWRVTGLCSTSLCCPHSPLAVLGIVTSA